MYSIRPYQAYSSHCWFSNNSVRPFPWRCLFKLFCGRSWHFLLNSPMTIIYLLFFRSGGIVMLLSSTHLLGLSGPCFHRAYPFNRSIVFLFSSSFILSSFSSLFNRSDVRDISYPLFHSFNCYGGSVLWFHQVSSHLFKFMFNSFHLQSECCPNYIILNPFLSCFNRSGFNIYLSLQPQGFFAVFFVTLF